MVRCNSNIARHIRSINMAPQALQMWDRRSYRFLHLILSAQLHPMGDVLLWDQITQQSSQKIRTANCQSLMVATTTICKVTRITNAHPWVPLHITQQQVGFLPICLRNARSSRDTIIHTTTQSLVENLYELQKGRSVCAIRLLPSWRILPLFSYLTCEPKCS